MVDPLVQGRKHVEAWRWPKQDDAREQRVVMRTRGPDRAHTSRRAGRESEECLYRTGGRRRMAAHGVTLTKLCVGHQRVLDGESLPRPVLASCTIVGHATSFPRPSLLFTFAASLPLCPSYPPSLSSSPSLRLRHRPPHSALVILAPRQHIKHRKSRSAVSRPLPPSAPHAILVPGTIGQPGRNDSKRPAAGGGKDKSQATL